MKGQYAYCVAYILMCVVLSVAVAHILYKHTIGELSSALHTKWRRLSYFNINSLT